MLIDPYGIDELDKSWAYVKRCQKITQLPQAYRDAEEWARIWVAGVIQWVSSLWFLPVTRGTHAALPTVTSSCPAPTRRKWRHCSRGGCCARLDRDRGDLNAFSLSSFHELIPYGLLK